MIVSELLPTPEDYKKKKTGLHWYKMRNDKNCNIGNELLIGPVDLNQVTRVNMNIKVDVNMHLGVRQAYSEFSPLPEYHKLNQSCG